MKSKLLKMLVVFSALVSLSVQRPLAADCAFTFAPGTTLDSDVTVYPNWTVLPGELNTAHGFTTPGSWFAVNVSNPNSPIPVGVYPAWCVDESHFLPATFSTIPGEPYSGTVIATCDAAGLVDVPSRGGTPPVGPPPITSLETWKKLNYLLNHKAGNYWWDVQVAVHRLVGGPSPNDPNLADPDLRFPPTSAAAIDAMIADAEANAATWTVPCGGVVGVLYVIDDPLDISLYQLLVLEVPFISTPTVTCPNDIVLQQTKGNGGFYCGYTQGGWGATPSGNNPGMLLKNNFATAYPTGVEIGIPGTSGYSLKFTSAAAIEAFLPAGSTASSLTADAVNPTSCSAGVFAGQVLACTLNVRFSAAGITPNISGQFGNLVYTEVGSPLNGKTVNQILAIANTLLGGGSYPGVTIASMNSLMTSFNEGFDNCSATAWASAHLLPAAQPVDTTPASTGFATAMDTCDVVITYTDEVTPGSCGGYEIKRTWTATNPLGNFSSCTQTIVVLGNTPPLVTVNSGAICTGDSFTLTASGASVSDTFLWSNGETTQSITVSPSSTTTYTVTVIGTGGCNSTAMGTVTVTPPPTVSVPPASICAGDVVTLTANGSAGVTYRWSNGATTKSITVSPNVTTTYTVTATSVGGCSAVASALVTVNSAGSVAGTFNFAGSSASTGAPNTRTYTDANGVSVKVTGFSRSSAGVWAPGFVGAYSGGLGITDVNEDGSAPGHTTDNVGNDNYLLFEFSQPVIVTSAALGYVATDSDLSVRIGTFADPFGSHITLSDAALAAFTYSEENAGGSATRTATLNSGGVIGNALVIAASLTDKVSADQFKVQTLNIRKPVCYSPVSIGNFVWKDVNQNGIQDTGEVGINGVKLNLTGTSVSGVPVSLSTTTTGNGGYLFSNLEPGTYTVTVDASNFATAGVLNGYTASPTLAGTNRAVDSNVNPSGTSPAALPSAASDLTVDFGFTPPAAPVPCTTVTFDFNGSSATDGTDGNVRTYTVNGVSVRASAFSRDRATGAWAKAYLGTYAGGLGVTDSSEGTGADSSHTVDNMGGRDNYVLFEFSQPVVVNRTYLGYVVNDSDLTAWVGNVATAFSSAQMLSDSYLSHLRGEDNNTTLTTARWASLNGLGSQGNTLIVAASVSDATPDDKFKIQKLDVCATTATSCPSPWNPKDYGCSLPGYTSANCGTYTVKGSGSDIWGSSDCFRYVSQPASGDCSVVVRVTSIQNCDPWSKAGVMIRESLSPDAKHCSMFVTPGNGVAFQCRTATSGSSFNNNVAGKCAPYWLKVVRSGSTFTGYYSTNGTTWTSCGSQTISMTSSVYIGLAVTSHDAGSICTSTFDSITATP